MRIAVVVPSPGLTCLKSGLRGQHRRRVVAADQSADAVGVHVVVMVVVVVRVDVVSSRVMRRSSQRRGGSRRCRRDRVHLVRVMKVCRRLVQGRRRRQRP